MALPKTRVLPVTSINPPHVDSETNLLTWWNLNKDRLPQDQVNHLLEAAHALQKSSIPVAFPTETVYGLGADATRSEAVRGIYTAKQRPSDNPLIVHIGSLDQLRALLRSQPPQENGSTNGIAPNTSENNEDDPIPSIYHPLIQHFWPGPLTLLFPLPSPSPFAAEVTPSSLTTVGIRMPSSPLARLLISLSDRPLAAPSANASTRPSPTTAAHVLHDLEGRIEMILDGGACEVGVESTVVDGLDEPPAVLRPGGVGIEEIRKLGGVWGGVVIGYHGRERGRASMNGDGDGDGAGHRNGSSTQAHAKGVNSQLRGPRAPGMKYRHYAPRARVHLFERRRGTSTTEDDARAKAISCCKTHPLKIGIITTKTWRPGLGFPPLLPSSPTTPNPAKIAQVASDLKLSTFHVRDPDPDHDPKISTQIYSVSLGANVEDIARGLFTAMRGLDGVRCGVILIEGIGDAEGEGELAAAVMDRLRKAGEEEEEEG